MKYEVEQKFPVDDLASLEVKLAATVRKDWADNFAVLKNLKSKVGKGAVVCLCKEPLPLTGAVTAVPVGII